MNLKLGALKQSLLIACVASFVAMSEGFSQNLVTNGDFESGSGATFSVTPGWFNRGGDQNAIARRDTLLLGNATHNAVINNLYDIEKALTDFDREAFGRVVHSQNTEYVIQAGDSFAISYDWRTASDWDIESDQVRMVLFATSNDRLNGEVVWSEVLDSGTADTPNTWQSFTANSSGVSQAAVGRTLFINFFGVQGGAFLRQDTGFARVDNMEVIVIPRR